MSRATPPATLAAVVVLCGLVDGVAGLVIGVAVAVALRRGATGRQLLQASVATFVLVAIAALVPGLPDRLAISSRFVADRLLAHHLAFGGAVLLVVGVLRDHLETADRGDAR